MAIQPIDLQTLFTQIDKVGKTQAAQREGLAIQQAIEGIQIQRKTEENVQAVNKAQDTGDGVEKVKDRKEEKFNQAGGGEKRQDDDDEEKTEAAVQAVISDPSLGKNIDISM